MNPTQQPPNDASPTSRPALSARDARMLRRNQWLAQWLDSKFGIPGTRFKFGLESLIGLIPVIGDYTGAILSSILIIDAARTGISKRILAIMAGNVLFELLVGAIPVLGDVFDFFFKANIRNAQLIESELERYAELPEGSKRKPLHPIWLILFVALLLTLITAFWLTIGYFMARLLFG